MRLEQQIPEILEEAARYSTYDKAIEHHTRMMKLHNQKSREHDKTAGKAIDDNEKESVIGHHEKQGDLHDHASMLHDEIIAHLKELRKLSGKLK